MNSISPSIFGLPDNKFGPLIHIGDGSFATVYRCRHLVSKVDMAVKIFDKKENNKEELMAELKMHESIHFPLIVEYYGMIENENYFCVFMELVEGLSLLDKVNALCSLDERQATIIFIQLLASIKYLHQKRNIVHRDLKLENILVDKHNNIRLIDFGLSKNYSENSLMTTPCGSMPYCAPEIIENIQCPHPYTESVDIWSLGVIYFSMIAGNLPFYDANTHTLINKIRFQEPDMYFPNGTSDGVYQLISRMLIKDPKHRITINEICNHPYIAQNPFSAILNHDAFSKYFFGPPKNLDERIAARKDFAERLYRIERDMGCFRNDVDQSPQCYTKSTSQFFSFQLLALQTLGVKAVTDVTMRNPVFGNRGTTARATNGNSLGSGLGVGNAPMVMAMTSTSTSTSSSLTTTKKTTTSTLGTTKNPIVGNAMCTGIVAANVKGKSAMCRKIRVRKMRAKTTNLGIIL